MTALETGTDDLLAEVDRGVAVITMNRPARRNALSPAMLSALGAVLARVETDDAVGCVVLTGAGGAFCAGGDVKNMSARADAGDASAGPALDAAIHRQRLSQRATSGTAVGHAEADDRRDHRSGSRCRASPSRWPATCATRCLRAVLTTAFARVGFAGDYGGTWFLTQLVGSSKAKELYYFSERLSAAEAAQPGDRQRRVPGRRLRVRRSWPRARQLADGPAMAYRYMKENLNRAVTASWVNAWTWR